MAFLSFHNQLHRIELTAKRQWIIAGVFLLLAVFTAWRTEYLKTSSALRLHMDDIAFGNHEDGNGHPADTAVILLTEVADVNEPSVADHWQLQLRSPSGVNVTMSPSEIHQNQPFVYVRKGSQHPVFYDPHDALYLKTATTPIPQGGKEVGILVFDLPKNVSRNSVEMKGTLLLLSCQDVLGNVVATHFVWKGGPPQSGPFYEPGIEEPH